jgi:hypothetical protein
MGFEYDDGSTSIVVLGGVDKKTGKKNPTELIGYFLKSETINTKFGEKPLYVFKTSTGTKAIIGTGNLNKIMASKVPGLLTHVIDTGEKRDVGKGNPMKVFRVGQDPSDSMDAPRAQEASFEEVADEEVSSLEEETVEELPASPTPPAQPAKTPSADKQAQLRALLNKAKASK